MTPFVWSIDVVSSASRTPGFSGRQNPRPGFTLMKQLGSFIGSVGRSRRAHGDSPLDLHHMPPSPLTVVIPGRWYRHVSCGSDALSTQFLNGCHRGYVTHQPFRLVWFVVVHWTFPAGTGASRERTSSYFNPGHDFYPGARWKCDPGGMPMDAASSASLNGRGGFPRSPKPAHPERVYARCRAAAMDGLQNRRTRCFAQWSRSGSKTRSWAMRPSM